MNIKYDVEIPKANRIAEYKPLSEFILSKHSNMQIEYDTHDEAVKRRNALRAVCKREKLNVTLMVPQNSSSIYITRRCDTMRGGK